MASFGNRLFADVIMVRLGHAGVECSLNPIVGVLIRRGEFAYRHTKVK